MKTREEAVTFIHTQFDHGQGTITGRTKPSTHHYGLQELRELMDFIYEQEPAADNERIGSWSWVS